MPDPHDPHDPHDPLEQAYRQAEALLADAEARAARRARVLAAVGQVERQRPAGGATTGPLRRAPSRWWTRWLVAASVAGLGVLVLTRLGLRQDAAVDLAQGPAAASAPDAFPAATVVAQAQTAPAAEALRAAPAAAPTAPATLPETVPSTLPSTTPPLAAAPRADRARGAAPAPARPTTSSRVEPPASTDSLAAAPAAPLSAPPPVPPAVDVADADAARTPAVAAAPIARAKAAEQNEPAAVRPAAAGATVARLARDGVADDGYWNAVRAAQAGDVARWLDQGLAVDTADAQGDTALMLSVRGGWVEGARLLVRRGANLDRRNRAGQSARELARSLNDPAMNTALGLAPAPTP